MCCCWCRRWIKWKWDAEKGSRPTLAPVIRFVLFSVPSGCVYLPQRLVDRLAVQLAMWMTSVRHSFGNTARPLNRFTLTRTSWRLFLPSKWNVFFRVSNVLMTPVTMQHTQMPPHAGSRKRLARPVFPNGSAKTSLGGSARTRGMNRNFVATRKTQNNPSLSS